MKLFVSLFLVGIGLPMLATPYLPVGLAMAWCGWWLYERSGWRSDDDRLAAVVFILGSVGAVGAFLYWLFKTLL
jgi:hypothetical protein